MTIGKTLWRLRREKGLSQAEAAAALTARGLAVTQKAVSHWERGDAQPGAEAFLLLCQLYGVRDVLSVFLDAPAPRDRLNALGRKRVQEYIRLLEGDGAFSDRPTASQPRLRRILPLYELPVSAGTGQFLDSDRYEPLEVDETVPLSATFAVRISGDSMAPRFADRQIVFVQQQQTLAPGEVGVFLLNGDGYCKLFSGGGQPALISLNPKYAPIAIGEGDELRVLGKVVG